MLICIADVLGKDALARVKAGLASETFVDGQRTAGWAARGVKRNLQLGGESSRYAELDSLVREALAANDVFVLATMPKVVRPVLFNRYDTGMSYGDHVDDALMGPHGSVRSDVSFTLFLSDPTEYGGGELVIEDVSGAQPYKLAAGSLVLYPSSYLHRVELVSSGTRLAAVGWLQCMVRDPSRRQIIFDIERVRRSLFERDGKSQEFDALSRCGSNLLRMWAEP